MLLSELVQRGRKTRGRKPSEKRGKEIISSTHGKIHGAACIGGVRWASVEFRKSLIIKVSH
jgi:hypothetical protein